MIRLELTLVFQLNWKQEQVQVIIEYPINKALCATYVSLMKSNKLETYTYITRM